MLIFPTSTKIKNTAVKHKVLRKVQMPETKTVVVVGKQIIIYYDYLKNLKRVLVISISG